MTRNPVLTVPILLRMVYPNNSTNFYNTFPTSHEPYLNLEFTKLTPLLLHPFVLLPYVLEKSLLSRSDLG